MFELKTSLASRPINIRTFTACLATILLAGCQQMQQQMQQPGYYNLPAASSATDALAQAEGSYANQAIRAPNQIQFDLRKPVTATAVNTTSTGSASASGTVNGTANTPAKPAAAAQASPVTTDGQTAIKPYDAAGAPTDLPPTDLSTTQNNATPTYIAGASVQSALIPDPQTFSGTLPCFHPEMKCSAQRITLSLAPNGRWRARAAYLDQNNQNGPVQADQGCWRTTPMNPPRVMLLNAQGDARAEFSMPSGNTLRLISMNGESPNLTYTLSRQPDLDPISELDKQPPANCP